MGHISVPVVPSIYASLRQMLVRYNRLDGDMAQSNDIQAIILANFLRKIYWLKLLRHVDDDDDDDDDLMTLSVLQISSANINRLCGPQSTQLTHQTALMAFSENFFF